MATLAPGTVEHIVIDGVDHVGLRDWARINGLTGNAVKHVVRCAQKTNDDGTSRIAGARQTIGRLWIIPTDTPIDVVPAMGAGSAPRRDDGRRAYIVFWTDDEHVYNEDKYEHVDMRERRRAQRAARKNAPQYAPPLTS